MSLVRESQLVRREPPTGTCQWLRFYDSQENLVLLPAEVERQRAERLAERLRSLRFDWLQFLF